MRSLFALRLEPVSVISTIASTRPAATLTSVAPQLNSTSAFTLFFFRYAFVTETSSVAMRFPLRSFTERIFEVSGTAITQRTLFRLCFAYSSSSTLFTLDEFSHIQSSPVIPQSRAPSSTYLDISCARNNTGSNSGSSIDGK